MNKEEFISSGLLELYAMQVSSPEETQIVEEALKKFPELKQELDDIELSLEKYAQANAIAPPPSAKEKFMNRVFEKDGKEENKNATVIPFNKKSAIPMFYKWIAAASIILLIGSIILNYSYYEKYHDSQKDLAAAQQKIEQQQKSNLAMSQDMDIVTNKYAQPVLLKGTAKAPDAVAKIFWMKNTGDVYINPTNLPQAPAGKQYQLWAIVDGKPVDGGMIVTEKGTYHIQKMKSFGKADAFAITLEKAGGSPTPTMSEMVVIAKM
ncbi:MAG TPA: anti-sigma factor [Hanamia sp.]|nr:anti-sigma factor [Hanamia sp.]